LFELVARRLLQAINAGKAMFLNPERLNLRMEISPLQYFVPYKLFLSDSQPYCRWLYLGNKHITEPFFADTITASYQFEQNTKFIKSVSTLDMLTEWAEGIDTAQPSAFIFHISRCGSTLLSQLLSIDPANVVLSEVPFFDELLRIGYNHGYTNTAKVDEWLKAAIDLYGQKRTGKEQHVFIKTDCWHIFFYERLRKLYPGIPFILLYRSPAEVLQSQQRLRGMQAVREVVQPGVMGIELKEDDPAMTNLDIYFSKVMEKILAAFDEVIEKDPRTILVNYNEGMLAVTQKLLSLTGIEVPADISRQMQERVQYHGKYPGQVFEKEKKADTADFLDKSIALYEKLEARRHAMMDAKPAM
jgi:hypothetical protein